MDSLQHPNEFPGFDRAFWVADTFSNRALRAELLELENVDVYAMCRGVDVGVSSLRARWAMGGARPADVVFTTYARPMLISERVLDLLTAAGVTGWGSIPCTLWDKHGDEWQYYLLTVRGRCGPIIGSKSSKFYEQMPGGVFPRWRGFYFDVDTWDGSDIFVIFPQFDLQSTRSSRTL
jgi:hypothetical protein